MSMSPTVSAGRKGLVMGDKDYEVGYGRPPRANQFPPNTSGNPKGAPKGRRKTLPHEAVLGREVTVIEDGVRRKMAADEAFLLHLVRQGLAKEGPLRSLAMEAMDQPQAQPRSRKQRLVIFTRYPGTGDIDKPMRQIGMAHLLDPFRPSAKLVIEPWLVQVALARLGDRRLTAAEQQTIVTATRKPHSAKWPDWWEVTLS